MNILKLKLTHKVINDDEFNQIIERFNGNNLPHSNYIGYYTGCDGEVIALTWMILTWIKG